MWGDSVLDIGVIRMYIFLSRQFRYVVTDSRLSKPKVTIRNQLKK
jgi:hypothetical protein